MLLFVEMGKESINVQPNVQPVFTIPHQPGCIPNQPGCISRIERTAWNICRNVESHILGDAASVSFHFTPDTLNLFTIV